MGCDHMFNNKKIPYVEFLPIIIITIIAFKIITSIGSLTLALGNAFSIFSYFVWGFCIAYLLNPLMVYMERRLKLKRVLCLFIIYFLFIGLVTLFITLITPGIVKSISDLLQSLPGFIFNTQSLFEHNKTINDLIQKYNLYSYIDSHISLIIEKVNSFLTLALNTTWAQIISFTSIFIKFTAGLVISVYMLKDKETIISYLKKFIFSILHEKPAKNFLSLARKANIICYQFVIGKTLDSLIVGMLCFAGLMIINTPYAMLISLFFGLTNMIPYFGNLIGMIPAFIIAFIYSPVKSIEVVIFLLILMQFDAWFLSPKILGKRVGISPLWVLLGITIGGGLSGIIGMFIGVPTIAFIKTLLEGYMEKKLKEKNIQNLS